MPSRETKQGLHCWKRGGSDQNGSYPFFEHDSRYSEFRVVVTEHLQGLTDDRKELLIELPSNAPLNVDYFFDVWRTDDGVFRPSFCGDSGLLEGPHASPHAVKMLDYLRAVKGGATDTGSAVFFVKPYDAPGEPKWVDGVKVTLEPGTERRETIPSQPYAKFERLKPGTYRVTASKPGFSEVKVETTNEITVTPRSCLVKEVSLIPAQR